jgi:hypothetical protein
MPYRLHNCILLFVLVVCASACTTVKSYQSQHLKDHNMQPNALAIEKLESEADSYREGASGGTGGKSGGGCGCN